MQNIYPETKKLKKENQTTIPKIKSGKTNKCIYNKTDKSNQIKIT